MNEVIIRRFFAGTTNDQRALLAACWHFGEGAPPHKSMTEDLAIDIARAHIPSMPPAAVSETLTVLAGAGVFDVARDGVERVYTFTDRGAVFGGLMQRAAEKHDAELRAAEVAAMHERAQAAADEAARSEVAAAALHERILLAAQGVARNERPSADDVCVADTLAAMGDLGRMPAWADPLVQEAKKLVGNVRALDALQGGS